MIVKYVGISILLCSLVDTLVENDATEVDGPDPKSASSPITSSGKETVESQGYVSRLTKIRGPTMYYV